VGRMKMMRVYARLSRISWRASKRGTRSRWRSGSSSHGRRRRRETRRRSRKKRGDAELISLDQDPRANRLGDDHPSPNPRKRQRTTPTTTQLT